MSRSYGTGELRQQPTKHPDIAQKLNDQGFAVVHDVLTKQQIKNYSQALDAVYEKQQAEFGREALDEIGELNIARMPFLYDQQFLQLLKNDLVQDVVAHQLGANYILSLQNGIISHPNEIHHQSAWHRDLPYQDYSTSKPVAINAFFCLDEFLPNNLI